MRFPLYMLMMHMHILILLPLNLRFFHRFFGDLLPTLIFVIIITIFDIRIKCLFSDIRNCAILYPVIVPV